MIVLTFVHPHLCCNLKNTYHLTISSRNVLKRDTRVISPNAATSSSSKSNILLLYSSYSSSHPYPMQHCGKNNFEALREDGLFYDAMYSVCPLRKIKHNLFL